MKRDRLISVVVMGLAALFVLWVWTFWPNWTVRISKWYTLPFSMTIATIVLWKFGNKAVPVLIFYSVVFLALCIITYVPHWGWGEPKRITIWWAFGIVGSLLVTVGFFAFSHSPKVEE